MAFRLKAHRSTERQLRRLVRDELDRAIDSLMATDGEAVHDARKRLKRARAVIKLLHGALGSSYDEQNGGLRSVAHRIAPLRDADALREAFAALHGRYAGVIGPSLAHRVEATLDARARSLARDAIRLRRDAARALEMQREATIEAVAEAAGRGAIRDGLARGYRRARQTMPAAGLDAGPADFHLWRRRVKDYSYQVRLFESLSPEARQWAAGLKQLGQALGDDHNLTCLRDTITAAPEQFGDAPSVATVLGCISKRQRALRQRALETGPRSFAPSMKRMRKQARQWVKELEA